MALFLFAENFLFFCGNLGSKAPVGPRLLLYDGWLRFGIHRQGRSLTPKFSLIIPVRNDGQWGLMVITSDCGLGGWGSVRANL